MARKKKRKRSKNKMNAKMLIVTMMKMMTYLME